MRLLAGVVVLLVACGCSPLAALNALVPERGFVRHEGIAYGALPRQRLDVYVPRVEGSGALPVVVFFYGGSWQGGSRENFLFVAEALTSRGFVVVVPDYRVYPEVRYPGFVEDGALAVSWTAANIGRHRGDASRIALMGHSAGAQIAAMLAYNRRFLDAKTRSGVNAMVGLAGPYDFTPTDPVIATLLAGEGDVKLAMPSRYVQGGEPPSLLVTGDNDTTVNPSNTARLERRLREAGSPVEVLRYPSLGHVKVLASLAAPFRDDGLLDSIAQFLKQAPAGPK